METLPSSIMIPSSSPPQSLSSPQFATVNTTLGHQDYMLSVHKVHQLISNKATGLHVGSEEKIAALSTVCKNQSRHISNYEEYLSMLQNFVPQITTNLESLLGDILLLGDTINELQEMQNSYIVDKNEFLVERYRNSQTTECDALNAKYAREISLLERWVKDKRDIQVMKAIDQYKQQTQQLYESKLKNAILEANATPLTPATSATSTTPPTPPTTPPPTAATTASIILSTQTSPHPSTDLLNHEQEMTQDIQ